MKTVIGLLLLVGVTGLSAQTKRIAHRSHSGSDNSLTLDGSANFGLGPEPHYWMEPDTAQAIDSVSPAPVPTTVPTAVEPIPVPSAVPANPPQEPTEPEVPQKQAAPHESDSLETSGPSGTPNISGGRDVQSSTPTAQATHVTPPGEHSRGGRLLWLGLALAFPAAGLVLFGAMRRNRSAVG